MIYQIKDKKMKIAFIFDMIYPFNIGGVEVRNYEIAKRLVKKGHEVHLYGGKFWKGKDIIKIEGNNEEVYERLAKTLMPFPKGKEGLQEVRQLLDYSKSMGLDFIQFNPSLARGLDYYTGTTIEVYLKNKDIVKSAILAGGRFDDMVGDFRGDNEEIPAVGFSFGLERLVMILNDYKSNIKAITTDLYLIPIGTVDECLGIAHRLRNQGLNVDMDLQGRKKVGQSISYADSLGVPYVGLVGENEINEGVITIKNLETRTQEKMRVEEIYKHLRKD